MYYLTRDICGGQVALGQGSSHPNPLVLNFFPSVSLLQCLVLIFTLTLLFSEGQAGKA